MAPAWRYSGGLRWVARTLVLFLVLGAFKAGLVAGAEELQAYRVTEFVVTGDQMGSYWPLVDGEKVIWGPSTGFPTYLNRITIRNLRTGQELHLDTPKLAQWPVGVDGDRLVTTEDNGVYLYHLPDGARTTVAPPRPDAGFFRGPARIAGDIVVWTEGIYPNIDVYARNLATGDTTPISSQSSPKEGLVLRGTIASWLDRRHVSANREESDIYAYSFEAGKELRLTSSSRYVSLPAIAGRRVVWATSRAGSAWIEGYDLALSAPLDISQGMTSADRPLAVAADGDIVAWSGPGANGDDIWGYDLGLGQGFIISRAVGNQSLPSVSGHTVVWGDWRHAGMGKYEARAEIYGARLEPGPAEPPPAWGVPSSTDAKIEILWPHGGAPVLEADGANIAVWLFQQGTLKLQPCQWSPTVRLWRSLNNQPAEMIAVGRKSTGHYFAGGRSIPTWEFNDVNVSAARDPRNRLFFWVTVDEVPSRSNIWAHAADPRTYFPYQDVPAGTGVVGDSVAARIEIVWPHDNAPVTEAKYVNVSASLFVPGSLLSVPPTADYRVRLFRSLNNGVSEPVAVGTKRILGVGPGAYPLWDFNDVDVSQASDPSNKYYFTLTVDGLQTFTNVWAHGADPRTYFPTMDAPIAACE